MFIEVSCEMDQFDIFQTYSIKDLLEFTVFKIFPATWHYKMYHEDEKISSRSPFILS